MDIGEAFRRAFWASPPRRTFNLYPLLVLSFELVGRRRLPVPRPCFLPLLICGYLQHSLTARYLRSQASFPNGFGGLPDSLVETGPFAYTRNPIYLGHLIFLLGLALAFRSPLGWAIFLTNIPWYHDQVLKDEARLRERFGREYEDYSHRVRRWIPFIL